MTHDELAMLEEYAELGAALLPKDALSLIDALKKEQHQVVTYRDVVCKNWQADYTARMAELDSARALLREAYEPLKDGLTASDDLVARIAAELESKP